MLGLISRFCNYIRTLRGAVIFLVILLILAGISALLLPQPSLGFTHLISAYVDINSPFRLIIFDFRLSRMLMACCAGAALGLSGMVLQRMMHNDLASPDILGINSGSAFTAMLGIFIWQLSGFFLVLFSFVGGLCTLAVVVLISLWSQRKRNIKEGIAMHMVLIGVGMNIALYGLINLMLAYASTPNINEALVWLSGSLGRTLWWKVGLLCVVLCIALCSMGILRKHLETLELSYEHSVTLGLSLTRSGVLLLLLVVFLVATTSALIGPCAFVGFGAGPLSRMLLKGKASLTLSTLMGATIMLCADVLGQIIPTGPYPVGIMSAAFGGPLLLWMMLKESSLYD